MKNKGIKDFIDYLWLREHNIHVCECVPENEIWAVSFDIRGEPLSFIKQKVETNSPRTSKKIK